MSRSDRVDPVQIVVRIGGVTAGLSDSDRAFEVWVYLARQAGWDVIEFPPDPQASTESDFGSVIVEGIKYKICYGLRVRQTLADDSTGNLTRRPVLAYTSWAEPDLESYTLE
jgi:hypothetical protein